jgi:cytidylate kinase
MQASDAIVIDNSNLTKEEQFDWVMKLVNQHIGSPTN